MLSPSIRLPGSRKRATARRRDADRLVDCLQNRRIESSQTYLLELEMITNRVPSSEKKICCTPCRKQLFVQAFISGSSMIFVPCCIFTQTCAQRLSSREWQVHRQQSARSCCAAGRETPVRGSEATTTARSASLGLHFIEVRHRSNSQIKELIRCML